MIKYNLKNKYPTVLRIIVEPESVEFDLESNHFVTVVASGNSPMYECVHFLDNEGINSISFWPDQGQVAVYYGGKNILDM